MANSGKSIIFDFDGVIADTFELCRDLTHEFDHILFSPEEYKKFFDGNIYKTGVLHRLISFHDPAIKRRLQDAYAQRIVRYLPVPGIREVIARYAAHLPLHIVTSGESSSIGDFLTQHNLRHHFGDILGYDVSHSKVEKFGMLGARGDAARNHLYVTDTLGDLREAAAAGLPAVAVTWGFHDEDRLMQGSPIAIARTPDQLEAALHAWQAR